jgi:hypothetical protein
MSSNGRFFYSSPYIDQTSPYTVFIRKLLDDSAQTSKIMPM